MADSIYRTPSAYLEQMIAEVRARGSALTDFHEGGVTRTFYEGHAIVLSEQSLVAEQQRLNARLATAAGDALDAKAADYFVDRHPAVAATGTVRISRPAAAGAVTIPAGWAPLQTVPAPGQPPIQVLTLQDAVFAAPDTFKDVTAQAITLGAAGNLAGNTQLLPLNPVAGFVTETGFKVQVAFTAGVDVETDDKFRVRVRTEVQGRKQGGRAALLAAALRTPGVESANVLAAGEARANATIVPAGQCEVYYEGTAALLTAVTSEVLAAAVLNQGVTVLQATAERLVADVTVFALIGVDAVAFAVRVRDALKAVANGVGVAGTVYISDAIRALDALEETVSVGIPLTGFRKFTDAPGAANIVIAKNKYPDLADADVSVAVTLI